MGRREFMSLPKLLRRRERVLQPHEAPCRPPFRKERRHRVALRSSRSTSRSRMLAPRGACRPRQLSLPVVLRSSRSARNSPSTSQLCLAATRGASRRARLLCPLAACLDNPSARSSSRRRPVASHAANRSRLQFSPLSARRLRLLARQLARRPLSPPRHKSPRPSPCSTGLGGSAVSPTTT